MTSQIAVAHVIEACLFLSGAMAAGGRCKQLGDGNFTRRMLALREVV